MNGNSAVDLNERGRLEICGWALDEEFCRLVGPDREVKLEPRIMQVLACLLRTGGEPITREALMVAVWGHRHATADALNRTVSRVRKVLKNDLACDAIIETLPKIGYRLVVPSSARVVPAAMVWASPKRKARWLALLALIVSLLGLVVGTYTKGHANKNLSTRVVPVTSLPGYEIQPDLSPDGRNVVFSHKADSQDSWHLYRKSIGDGLADQLTFGPANDLHPVWSPDGAKIAFLRMTEESCTVLVMATSGQSVRPLGSCNSLHDGGLAWTSKGTGLVFLPRDHAGLFQMEVATGILEVVTRPAPDTLYDSSPRLSRDGRSLAFVRWRADGLGDMYVTRDGRDRRITFDKLKIGGETWEPDDLHLVYASNREGLFSLWRVDLKGGDPELILSSGQAYEYPTMAPGGGRLVFEDSTFQANLFASGARASSKAFRQLTWTTRFDLNPSVSPDGSRLAFTSNRSGATEVWSMDIRSGTARQLTHFGAAYASNPSWSHDGRFVVFDSPGNVGNFDVYRLDTISGNAARLTDSAAEDRFAHYSRDERWIYFTSNRGGSWQAWRIPAAGGPAEPVTRDGAYYALPGDRGVVYVSRLDQQGIWAEMPGGATKRIVDDLTGMDVNNWTISGNRLWYVCRDSGGLTRLVEYDLTLQQELSRSPLPGVLYRSGIAFTEEGEVIYARAIRGEGDLDMVVQDTGG